MPGYGIQPASEGGGLLPWSWAAERLQASRNYWVATTRGNGRPHVMPVWGVWLDHTFWFSTARTSVKARNLRRDPNCVITTERADEAVILEGVAEVVGDRPLLEAPWAAYKAKYNWDLAGESMFAVRPRVAFAFIETAEQFAGTATRWMFEG